MAARQERAAGRVLDDERLRGDLTDDEYQPLLDWALRQADRLAAATVGQDDDAADRVLDAGLDAVREAVRQAVRVVTAHAAGDRGEALAALKGLARDRSVADLAGSDAVPVWARLRRVSAGLSKRPDLAGAELAASIARALDGPATASKS